MKIYWNKRKYLHKKRVELPHDWLPFHDQKILVPLGAHAFKSNNSFWAYGKRVTNFSINLQAKRSRSLGTRLQNLIREEALRIPGVVYSSNRRIAKFPNSLRQLIDLTKRSLTSGSIKCFWHPDFRLNNFLYFFVVERFSGLEREEA